jgi:hypothetical protein
MKTKEIGFILESDEHGTLSCTYEFQIWRKKTVDKDYVPRWTSGLVSAILSLEDEDHEWEFGSGEDMSRELKLALRYHDAEISELIEEKMKQIVNDPHYEGNNDADPRDPAR